MFKTVLIATLAVSAFAGSELQFQSGTKGCSIKYDGSKLSTTCTTGTGFTDIALGKKVTQLENLVKDLKDDVNALDKRVFTLEQAADSPVTYLSSPYNLRMHCSRAEHESANAAISGVPSDAKAIIASLTTFNDHRNDHVTHTFGRSYHHTSYTWDNNPWNHNSRINDVLVTHNGDSGGRKHYGNSAGSQLIPLDNGYIRSYLCTGHSRGNHYVTLEVFGFVGATSPVEMIPAPQIIRQHCSSAQHRTFNAPSGVPRDASAIIASIHSFDDHRNDHVVHTFGRNMHHSGHTWDNQAYSHSMNDIAITHNGDGAEREYYGKSHGTQIIPLTSHQIQSYLCTGRSRGNHYITLQVYGYVPAKSSVKFVKPTIVRQTCNHAKRTHFDMPSVVPAGAKAVIVSMHSYDDHRNDHVIHTFGRDSNHPSHTWDNQVYNTNRRYNDVMVTHDGDSGGKQHYGAEHGTLWIPLNGRRIESYLCTGHSRGTHYVALSIYGYAL